MADMLRKQLACRHRSTNLDSGDLMTHHYMTLSKSISEKPVKRFLKPAFRRFKVGAVPWPLLGSIGSSSRWEA